MKYRTIDLCAGIGGIRRGFEMTGHFKNILAAEIDEAAAKTYKELFKDDPLNDLTSEEFKEKVVNCGGYEVLLAGFPCQTFSRAGKQLGFRDKTKGTIFFEIADILSRTHPRAIFLENVENLISHDKGETIRTIVKTLEDELDYRLIGVTMDEDGEYVFSSKSFIRNSRYFGVPQNRPRAYIMGFSKKVFGDAVKLLCDDLPNGRETHIFADLNEVLEQDVPDKYYMASGYLRTLEKHREREKSKGNGFGYVVVNREGIKSPVANTILATGGSGKERNLVYQPKEGIAGKLIQGKKTALNDKGIRVMTPTEWGRLQGFIDYGFLTEDGHDAFRFPEDVTDTQKYKQFGNSVTIPVIEQMALFMLACFEKLTENQTALVAHMASTQKEINRRDVILLLRVTPSQATYILRLLVDDGILSEPTRGKHAKYQYIEQHLIRSCSLPSEINADLSQSRGLDVK